MRLLLLLIPWFCGSIAVASDHAKEDYRLDYSKIYELRSHCDIPRFLVGARRADQKNLAPLEVSKILNTTDCDAVSLILSSTSNQQVLITGSATGPEKASLVGFTDSSIVAYKSGNMTRHRIGKANSTLGVGSRKDHRIYGLKKQPVDFNECFIDFSIIYCPVVDREEQTVTLRRWFLQGNEILDDDTDDHSSALRIRFNQDVRHLGKIFVDSDYNDIAITFKTYNGHESKKVSIRNLFALHHRGLLVIPKFMPQAVSGVTSAFSHRYMWVTAPSATTDPLEVYRSERLRPYISQKVMPGDESKHVWGSLVQNTGRALNTTILRKFSVVMNPNFTRAGLFNIESRATCEDKMNEYAVCQRDLKSMDINQILIIVDGVLLGVLVILWILLIVFIVICLKQRRRREIRRKRRLRKRRKHSHLKKRKQLKKTPGDPTQPEDPVQQSEADVDSVLTKSVVPGKSVAPGDVAFGDFPEGPDDDDDDDDGKDGSDDKGVKEGFFAKKVAKLLKEDDDDDDEVDPGKDDDQRSQTAHEQQTEDQTVDGQGPLSMPPPPVELLLPLKLTRTPPPLVDLVRQPKRTRMHPPEAELVLQPKLTRMHLPEAELRLPSLLTRMHPPAVEFLLQPKLTRMPPTPADLLLPSMLTRKHPLPAELRLRPSLLTRMTPPSNPVNAPATSSPVKVMHDVACLYIDVDPYMPSGIDVCMSACKYVNGHNAKANEIDVSCQLMLVELGLSEM
ncbi:hypothetical protein AAVH_04540 [Aphelenchoides avenae]|nr:hypothetical protein AAVH_04540 [Aphelenchus avenae]